MRTYSLEEAAGLLKRSPRSLADKRYRLRIGLPARKVGRGILFLEEDLRKLLERGKEPFPGERQEGRR